MNRYIKAAVCEINEKGNSLSLCANGYEPKKKLKITVKNKDNKILGPS